MNNAPARIVLVGHCTPDSWVLKSVIARAVPGALIVVTNDTEALERELASADVLLVNRALDGEFGVDNGIELIRGLAARRGRRWTMLLVSNYEDAQAEAVAAGAMPGFGKTRAGTEETAKRIAAAAEAAKASRE